MCTILCIDESQGLKLNLYLGLWAPSESRNIIRNNVSVGLISKLEFQQIYPCRTMILKLYLFSFILSSFERQVGDVYL